MKSLNKYSKTITQDPTQPAAQAMLHAIGLTTDDFNKAIVGIASTGYEGNPCNMHLNDLANLVKKGTLSKDLDMVFSALKQFSSTDTKGDKFFVFILLFLV